MFEVILRICLLVSVNFLIFATKIQNYKIMDADLRKKLKDLQKEIADHAKYIQESTYHPYNTIEGFVYKLDKIIDEDDNKDIWL